MLKDEFTGNPRWGQNVIGKVKLKILFPSWILKAFSGLFCYVSGK